MVFILMFHSKFKKGKYDKLYLFLFSWKKYTDKLLPSVMVI